MGPTIAVNDYVVYRIISQLGDQYAFNVRHFRIMEVTGAPTLDTVAGGFLALIQANYAACLPSVAQLKGVKCSLLRAGVDGGTVIVRSPRAGTYGTDVSSVHTSGIISLRTARAAQAGRGRMYIPFTPRTAIASDGHAVGLYILRLTTLASWFDGTIAVSLDGRSALIEPVVYHRLTNTADKITNAIVRTEVGTQRRRTYLRHGDTDPLL